MQTNLQKVIELAEEIAAPLGLLVVDARMSQSGKLKSLEVTICRKGGFVALSDCEVVSRQLEERLDKEQPPLIEGSFALEVQSPGIDRKLKSSREFAVFSGESVEIRTREKIGELGTDFQGHLVGVDDGRLVIAKPKPLATQQTSKKSKAKAGANPVPSVDSLQVDMNKVVHVKLLPAPPPKEAADGCERN